MFAPPSNPFNPPKADIPGIIDDLSSSIYTLGDIASRYDTTIEALAHWMARPDIAARIDVFEAAITRRARLQAAATMPSAISAAARILADFESESAHLPVNPKSIRDLERRTRAASVARAAATLIIRIARSTPSRACAPLPAFVPRTPTLQAEGLIASSRGVERGALPSDTPGNRACESRTLKECTEHATPEPCAQRRARTSWDLKLPPLPSPASGDDRCVGGEGRSVFASPSKVFPLLTATWADEPTGAPAFIINHLLHSVGLTISAHQRAPP